MSAAPMGLEELLDLANIRMVVIDEDPMEEADAVRILWSSGVFNIEPGRGFVFLNP